MGVLAAALSACSSEPDRRCVDRNSYEFGEYKVLPSSQCSGSSGNSSAGSTGSGSGSGYTSSGRYGSGGSSSGDLTSTGSSSSSGSLSGSSGYSSGSSGYSSSSSGSLSGSSGYTSGGYGNGTTMRDPQWYYGGNSSSTYAGDGSFSKSAVSRGGFGCSGPKGG